MGLMDLFKPNPSPGLSEDPGFSLPKLFDDESRARLGVLGSNLIAAGFGNSPNAGAVLGLGELGDRRKKDKKLKQMADRMADKQDAAGHHDIADALRADPTFLSTMMGKNIDQENAKAMKLFELRQNPFYMGDDESAMVDPASMGAAPRGDFGAPPMPPQAQANPDGPFGGTEPYQDYAIAPAPGFQDSVYRPGVEPAQAQAPAPSGPLTKTQKLIAKVRQYYPNPEITDSEAMQIGMAASKSMELGAAMAEKIQDNHRANTDAKAKITAAELARTQGLDDQRRKEAFDRSQAEEKARVEAEAKALPAKNFEESLRPVIPVNPEQTSPITEPPMTPEQVRQNQIIQKAGLPPQMNTPANAAILEAAAAAGPKEYADALAKMEAGPELKGGIDKSGGTIDQIWDPKSNSFKQIGGVKAPAGATPIMDAAGNITGWTGGPPKVAKVGEQQVQGMALAGSIRSAIPAAEKFYDQLSDESAMALFGGAGNFFMSDEAQQAQTAIRAISSASVYAKSGAASTDTERNNAAEEVTPKPWDKEGRIKLKKNMMIDQVALIEIRARAGIGDGTEENAPPMTAAMMREATQLAEARKKEAEILDRVKPAEAKDVPPMPQSAKDAGVTDEMWRAGNEETWKAFNP